MKRTSMDSQFAREDFSVSNSCLNTSRRFAFYTQKSLLVMDPGERLSKTRLEALMRLLIELFKENEVCIIAIYQLKSFLLRSLRKHQLLVLIVDGVVSSRGAYEKVAK